MYQDSSLLSPVNNLTGWAHAPSFFSFSRLAGLHARMEEAFSHGGTTATSV